MIYGYARVSTAGRMLAAQDAEPHQAGAAKVCREKAFDAARSWTDCCTRSAPASGVQMRRPPKLTKHERRAVPAWLDRGDETLTEIARSYAASHMTISRIKAQHALPV
jgi:DNA invertase Pin-like site-specific DNA recombinase